MDMTSERLFRYISTRGPVKRRDIRIRFGLSGRDDNNKLNKMLRSLSTEQKIEYGHDGWVHT